MRRHYLLPAALGAILTAGYGAEAGAAIKCWVNKDGVRECGTVVPPEYAQQEQTEISKGGVTTGKVERAKTPEELEAERQRAAAEAQAKAEADRKAQEQLAADRKLLDTYTSEQDILHARESRLADLESRIKITNNHIEKLNRNLTDIVQQAADMEKRGETPGENVAKDIENVRNQIREQEKFVADKRAEQDEVRRQFDSDLARYREMKSRTGAAQANNAAKPDGP